MCFEGVEIVTMSNMDRNEDKNKKKIKKIRGSSIRLSKFFSILLK
jgi:hypothetical protein